MRISPQRHATLLAAIVALLAGLSAFPDTGLAHLELVQTTPRDGARLDAPVERVVLRFTVPGNPVGPGIRILDAQGAEVPGGVRAVGDGSTFVVTPAAALEGGRFGVAWRVAAPDAHPKSGAFRFRVAATPAAAAADDPAGTPGSASGAEAEAASGIDAGDQEADDPLASALEAPDDRVARAVRLVGRILAYGGGLVVIGGLAFLAFAMVGTRREVVRCFALLRAAGAFVLVGGVVGVVGRAWLREGSGLGAALSPSALGAAFSGEAGLALVLAMAGGVLIAFGARAAFRAAPPVATAAWSHDDGSRIVGASVRNAAPALAGAAAVVLSLALNGHSASEGPRALVWAADFIHVVAAGVWLGGLALLCAVLAWRRRARRRLNAAYPAVRFATLAGAGVALAGLTGIGLAIVVLPAPSALWTSSWGLILMAKLAIVGIVAGMGAYNHFRLIPRLASLLDAEQPRARGRGDHGHAARRLVAHDGLLAGGATTLVRVEEPAIASSPAMEEVALGLARKATVELWLLMAVVVLTAALVGASAV